MKTSKAGKAPKPGRTAAVGRKRTTPPETVGGGEVGRADRNDSDARGIAITIVNELRARGNPAVAAALQRYFKEDVAALGIDTATLRSYSRERVAVLTASLSLRDVLEVADRLFAEAEIEIRGQAILLLARRRSELGPRIGELATRLLETRLDNWGLVDSFCNLVLSPLLEQDPALQKTVRLWSRHPSLWVRRAALVTLVPFARRGRLLDLAYQLVTERLRDPEDLLRKAMGWLLRESGKTDMARLKQFLQVQGPAVPRTTLRYAIERFTPSERQQLLKMTRSL